MKVSEFGQVEYDDESLRQEFGKVYRREYDDACPEEPEEDEA